MSCSKLAALTVSLAAIGACSPDSSLAPEPGVLAAVAAPASLNHTGTPAGITIHDPAYSAETILNALTTPQGSVGRGRGLTYFGISATGGILRTTNGSGPAPYTQLPLLPGQTRRALAYLHPAPDGGMYASDLRQNAVFHVDSDGNVSPYAVGLGAPYQTGLDSQARVYVAELTGRRVSRLAPDGSRSTVVQFTQLERPTGLSIDTEDNIYILSGATGRIRKFSIGAPEPALFFNLPVVATVPARSESNRADNMTFGPGGDLFVVGIEDVYRVSVAGVATLFVSGLNGPFNGISAATNNDLIVTEFADSTATGRVLRIRPNNRP